MTRGYKISRDRRAPTFCLSYRCPNPDCDNDLMAVRFCCLRDVEIWVCKKCEKKYELAFREITEDEEED